MAAHTKKLTLALEQLEDGIQLFLAGRYISSLTLLGSAEEVISRIIEERGGSPPMENMWKLSNELRSKMGKPHISRRELFHAFNTGRNQVKHHTVGEPQKVHHERFGEAFMMIQRAVSAASMLKLTYKGKKEYRQWLKLKGW
jgi:hypothetical protein